MSEYIKMADGSVVDKAYVVPRENGSIVIYVRGIHTFNEIAAIFCDQNKTSTMESHQNLDIRQWVGYTTVTNLQIEEEEAIICLWRF